jgi:hypothetical protein
MLFIVLGARDTEQKRPHPALKEPECIGSLKRRARIIIQCCEHGTGYQGVEGRKLFNLEEIKMIPLEPP